jgi:hypothetical protein
MIILVKSSKQRRRSGYRRLPDTKMLSGSSFRTSPFSRNPTYKTKVWYIFWENILPGLESDVLCYIGNLPEGCSVSEIDVNSILLNGTVPISEGSDTLLPSYPEFVDSVLRVGLNKREALLSLGLGGKGPFPGYRVTVEGWLPAQECGFFGSTWIKVREREPNKPLQVMAKTDYGIPHGFELLQNHPNPFNPETEISYDLPKDSWVKLSIYNIRGQKVKALVDGFEAAGHKRVHWDGTNEEGDRVASGVYLYRLEAGDFTATKKMVLLR